MRVLCSSVLVFEAIVVLLAIPVAVNTGTISGTPGLIAGGFVLAVLLVLGAGVLGRSWGLAYGWVLQALLVLAGLVVPLMFVVGGIFAVLWWLAIHYGRKGDALKAARSAS